MRLKRMTPLAVLALVAALVLASCGGGSDPLQGGGGNGGGGNSDENNGGKEGGSAAITIGSANFPESSLLARIYAGALRAKGVTVDTKLDIGQREIYIKALQDGSIDLVPEYTGNLLTYFDKSATATKPDAVYSALQKAVPSKLTVLDMSTAQDKDAVVVTKETADKLHLKTISDLKGKAPDLVLGAPPEWGTRPDGVPGLKRVYGLHFQQFRKLSGAQPVQFLKSGQVDAANIFTTDPAIKQNNFVALKDDKNLFSAQNVVPLITKDKASDKVTTTLNAISAKLKTSTLIELLTKVNVDKKDPGTVAKGWLKSEGLI